MPTISISSPTLTMPRSMRPVTTVPRPEIENTSSTGIRNGLSITRPGSGCSVSSAATSLTIDSAPELAGVALERLERRAANDRGVVAREVVLGQQLAHFHLDQLDQLGVVHHVALVQKHHDVRHPHLARQQDVLARLRHRPVGRRHHQDRAVHLRRAGDHVLHVVGMARAIHVRVVPRWRLVLHVRRRNRDPARLLFRRLVNLVVGRELAPDLLRHHLGQRRRQRRLAVIHVPNRPHVHVRLGASNFSLAMTRLRFSSVRSASFLRIVSATLFGTSTYFLNSIVKVARPCAHRAQGGRVAEHLAPAGRRR